DIIAIFFKFMLVILQSLLLMVILQYLKIKKDDYYLSSFLKARFLLMNSIKFSFSITFILERRLLLYL
ncbi:hypothetical protein ACT453_30635, partial [Bacillus sp. D-CC]